MANPNSGHDSNHVATISALSSVDGVTIVPLWADPTTHRLLTSSSGSGGITIGTTTITSGTTTRILYDNAGVVGEYTISGSGTVVAMANVATLSSLTSIGTIGTGVWQGTAVGVAYGGTGGSITASNGGVVYSDASRLQLLSGTATARKMLLSQS